MAQVLLLHAVQLIHCNPFAASKFVVRLLQAMRLTMAQVLLLQAVQLIHCNPFAASKFVVLLLQAMRLTMVQVLMNSKGLAMNPLQSLYYVSPACLICLLVPFCKWLDAREGQRVWDQACAVTKSVECFETLYLLAPSCKWLHTCKD